MKNVNLTLTVEELALLTALASDQLFRREFIDPKMPGYKADPAEVVLGKDLVFRMRAITRQASETHDDTPERTAGPMRHNRNRNLEAV